MGATRAVQAPKPASGTVSATAGTSGSIDSRRLPALASTRRRPFHVVKNLFRHRKARYKGMAKNQGQLFTLFGLANLVIAKRSLMDLDARGAS